MRAVLMRYGHRPDAVHEYSIRDCRAFMRALPVVNALEWAGIGEFDG